MQKYKWMRILIVTGLWSLITLQASTQTTFQSRYEYNGMPIRVMDAEGNDEDVLVAAHVIDTTTFFEADRLLVYKVDGEGKADDAFSYDLLALENNVIFNCEIKRLSQNQFIAVCSGSDYINQVGIQKQIVWGDLTTGNYKIYNDSTSQAYLEHIIVVNDDGFTEWRMENFSLNKRSAVAYRYDQFGDPVETKEYILDNADQNIPRAAVKIDGGSIVGITYNDLFDDVIDGEDVGTALLKLDEAGNVVLAYRYSLSYITSMTVDLEENIYAYHANGTVIKLDTDLNVIWSRSLESTAIVRLGFNTIKMYVDSDGNLVFTGLRDTDNELQSNRTMKMDPQGNLIMQKVMLDLSQRVSLGVTPLDDHIVSFGFLNSILGFDSYIRSVDKDGEAPDCMSIPMCYEAVPIEVTSLPITVEVEIGDNLVLDSTLMATPMSIETIHVCEPTVPPDASFNVIDSILCPSQVIEVIDTSVNAWGTSTWSLSELTFVDSSKVPDAIMLNQEGEFYLRHSLVFAGCEYVDSILINLSDDEISVALDDTICNEESIEIDLEPYSFNTILWEDGDTSKIKQIEEEGEYTFEYTNHRGCTYVEQFDINREYSPTMPPNVELIKCRDQQIILSTDRPIAPSWNTDFVGNNLSVTNPGIYTATFSNYCGEATQEFMVIDEVCDLAPIANIFSPNEDGINDLFEYSASGIEILEAAIYDRWGSQVHRYNGQPFWDGKHKDQNVISGVYTFFIQYRRIDVAEVSMISGDITVVR